jgi:hypothetical protein
VYGDRANAIVLTELPTRWDYADHAFANGIPETFPIDQSLHGLLGAARMTAGPHGAGMRPVLRNPPFLLARGLPDWAKAWRAKAAA